MINLAQQGLSTRCIVLLPGIVLCAVMAGAAGGAVQAAAEPGPEVNQVPDLTIVGWTVDDTDPLDGNGDGGLHPGETALLQIFLSNQGNETARAVDGQLSEVVDHPGVEILDKFATWPDLAATGTPAPSDAPHFRIRAETTRPCAWEVPLRLDVTAEGGHSQTLEFTLALVTHQTSDMADGAGRPFYFGADGSDRLGISVAAGDLDGDGFDDLILGALGDGPANGRSLAGEVTIIYGGPARSVDTDLSVPPAGVAFIYGRDPNDQLGSSVAAGDLDGDGFDDLILGASQGNGPANARSLAGEVTVIYGDPTRLPSLVDLASPPAGFSSLEAVIHGADSSDFLGGSVGAGDLDGDGFDDLILGARFADGPANARALAGEVAVLYGGPARFSGDIDLSAPPGGVAFIYGTDSNDNLGEAGVAAGDLDGDGFDEAILGAWDAGGPTNTRSGAGEVAVVYGDPGRLPPSVDLAFPPAGISLVYGADPGDFLGLPVTGDLDGDGFDDLILGAQGDGPGDARTSAGEAAVVYGGPGRLPASVDLASPPSGVAFIYGTDSLDDLRSAATGDLDGDGFDDLILGAGNGNGPANARGLAGEVAVIRGSANRIAGLDLASAPAGVEIIFGADSFDLFGTFLSTGDLDGDGFDDVILSAPLGDGPANARLDAGEVTAISGGPRSRYRHDPDVFSFIDATVGTDLGLACDDCSTTIPIGFTFDFFGRKATEVTVSSNGYLTFGGTGNRVSGPCPPASNGPNGTIAVLWDDWNPAAGGAVFSLLEGTAPNRRLTIQWDSVPHFNSAGTATFQATLFETSDQVLMQYLDTLVGTSADEGGTAVVGVENATGLNGAALSCFTPSITGASATRFRRFASPTVIFSDDVEDSAGGWTPTGLWHREDDSVSSCSPASRSGTWSWYYGQSSTCNYATLDPNSNPTANQGTLTSPVIASLPQDAALSFWHRRGTESGAATFDQSFVEAQGDGAGFAALEQVLDNSNRWRFSSDFLFADPLAGRFSSLDLSPHTGQDLEVRFRFDTVDEGFNNHPGWMIDDVTIHACPVFDPNGASGSGAASEARATAQPDTICETDPGMLDAVGSYCTACSTGLTYQWKEEGVPLGGATSVTHIVPAGHAAGTFDYTVAIECPTSTACAAESDPEPIDIVAVPAAVGPTLQVDLVPGSPSDSLVFTWTDVAGADDYVLLRDTAPDGSFATQAGTAVSGSPGLTLPVPADPLVSYLVAGRNPTCGLGPER